MYKKILGYLRQQNDTATLQYLKIRKIILGPILTHGPVTEVARVNMVCTNMLYPY